MGGERYRLLKLGRAFGELPSAAKEDADEVAQCGIFAALVQRRPGFAQRTVDIAGTIEVERGWGSRHSPLIVQRPVPVNRGLTVDDGPAIGMQHLAGHVADVLAGEEQEGRRDLVGLAGPPIGVSLPKSLISSGGWPPNGLSGVQIGPGATALTRMPSSTRFCDSERVKAVIAPLVAL